MINVKRLFNLPDIPQELPNCGLSSFTVIIIIIPIAIIIIIRIVIISHTCFQLNTLKQLMWVNDYFFKDLF